MRRTEVLQEIRRMRFEESYEGWTEGRLSQEEAAQLLGVCERTFRRYINRYEEEGLDGLIDKRLSQVSHRRAPVDEVMRMVDRYRSRHEGWSVRHYYAWYRRGGGGRSYNWVRKSLQAAGAVTKSSGRGQHRKRRERAPVPGVLLHQDGSTHAWVPGQTWDLIVTMDDASNRHYSMFFCDQEGTRSSFQGVREVIEAEGLFCSLYTDRGSHYWHTPTAGGKVDKGNSTQFRRALQQLGIEMPTRRKPEGAPSGPFAPTRSAWSRNWPPPSPIWLLPMSISGRCICPLSTKSLSNRRGKLAQPLCRCRRERSWTTFSANATSAKYVRTTALNSGD